MSPPSWAPPACPCLQGAQAIEVVQWVVEDPSDQHVWVSGIRSSFGLDIGLDVVVNDDKTKTFFNFDVRRQAGRRAPAASAWTAHRLPSRRRPRPRRLHPTRTSC